MMPYLLYEQGYSKALIDIYNLIERSQSNLKSLRINNAEHILKIINYYQDKEKINYHKLLPNYLKQPQAIEDKH